MVYGVGAITVEVFTRIGVKILIARIIDTIVFFSIKKKANGEMGIVHRKNHFFAK